VSYVSRHRTKREYFNISKGCIQSFYAVFSTVEILRGPIHERDLAFFVRSPVQCYKASLDPFFHVFRIIPDLLLNSLTVGYYCTLRGQSLIAHTRWSQSEDKVSEEKSVSPFNFALSFRDRLFAAHHVE
jgi:hypothetical protein